MPLIKLVRSYLNITTYIFFIDIKCALEFLIVLEAIDIVPSENYVNVKIIGESPRKKLLNHCKISENKFNILCMKLPSKSCVQLDHPSTR